MEERTYELKDESYIPLGINAGGIIMKLFTNTCTLRILLYNGDDTLTVKFQVHCTLKYLRMSAFLFKSTVYCAGQELI